MFRLYGNKQTIMENKIIIAIASGILYLAIILSIPFRRKAGLKKAGELIARLPKSKAANDYLIMTVCASLIGLCAFKSFGLMMNLVVAGCALMGTFISTKELSFLGHEGLYKNCIIANSAVLPVKEIAAIPEIHASESDKEYFDKTSLIIKKLNGNIQSFLFHSHEEKLEFISKILELRSDLKKK